MYFDSYKIGNDPFIGYGPFQLNRNIAGKIKRETANLTLLQLATLIL